MISSHKKFSTNEQTYGDWAQNLEEMRKKRHPTQNPVKPSNTSKPIPIQSSTQSREQINTHKAIATQYLEQWQSEHNLNVAEQNNYAEHEDENVVLTEEWTNAQIPLQGEVIPESVQKTTTIWYNPKHQPEPTITSATKPIDTTESIQEETNTASIPVTINVLEPRLININQPVVCLSEKELMKRLNDRLMPHLTDAVSGMVKTAVQRHASSLSFKLEKNLLDETPNLVNDVLNYHLKSVLAEIKRELKFKNKDF